MPTCNGPLLQRNRRMRGMLAERALRKQLLKVGSQILPSGLVTSTRTLFPRCLSSSSSPHPFPLSLRFRPPWRKPPP
eukprot:747471-Hanusia_phi.AAC.2